MAVDKESNAFTIGFAMIMVVVVAAGLSIAAMSLKPYQVKNKQREKMQNIVAAINVETSRKEAEKKFQRFVESRMILDSTGEKVSETSGDIDRQSKKEAFNIDVPKAVKNKGDARNKYPLYKCKKDGNIYYVIPMAGSGLWGPIWGFISLEDDHNTIYGATFDHKTETPGLGAEIANKPFQDQFKGKKILENGKFVSVDVVKGKANPDDPHAVDGITGGTITSHGVRDMLKRTLTVYVNYFKQLEEKAEA